MNWANVCERRLIVREGKMAENWRGLPGSSEWVTFFSSQVRSQALDRYTDNCISTCITPSTEDSEKVRSNLCKMSFLEKVTLPASVDGCFMPCSTLYLQPRDLRVGMAASKDPHSTKYRGQDNRPTWPKYQYLDYRHT